MDQLLDRVAKFHSLLAEAGVPYRLVGGMAVFLHVSARDRMSARLTRDIDAAIDRDQLPRVIAAAERAGWKYRHAAGIDMLVDAENPSARSAVHLVFLREKVRPEYVEEVPASEPERRRDGFFVASVADLVRMKLTSYRLKDRVHIQDLDGVGLITPEIEAGLPQLLRERLAEVRASE
ncbi:MAG: hypothetical protein R2729_20005 [Bryobacteraceae bacterium]